MFYATPDGQHPMGGTRNRQSRRGTYWSTVHVRTTTGQGENRQRNKVPSDGRSLNLTSSVATAHEAQRAAPAVRANTCS
jgi:hypothetical protein